MEENKNIQEFSFKTSEISTDNNKIYLSKFNDIILINNEQKDKEDEKGDDEEEEKKENEKKEN